MCIHVRNGFTYMFMLARDIVEKHRDKHFNPSKNIVENQEMYSYLHRNVSKHYVKRSVGNLLKTVRFMSRIYFSQAVVVVKPFLFMCYGCYSRYGRLESIACRSYRRC